MIRQWVPITCALLVSVVVAAGPTLAFPPTYEADTQVFVTTQTDRNDPNQDLFAGGRFAVDRVPSYAELASTPRVLDPVIRQLGLATSADGLASRVSTAVPAGTVLIDVTARDASAAGAADLANAVAARLGRVIEELETPAGGRPSPVKATVTRQAVPQAGPLWPSVPVSLAEGIAAGVLLGVVIAVVRRRPRGAVDGAAELARITDLPVLATVVRGTPRDGRSEDYRRLRTNLQFAFVDDRPRVVAVTGAVPGEGTTAVAGHLALSMRETGASVCLVDGDLRRPSVAALLDLREGLGLTDVLAGRATIDDVVQRTGDGLAVVPAGGRPAPPNPTELLASNRMTALLEELSRRYDTVVLDCPPLLPVADASVLANRSGGTIQVVRAGRTTAHQVGLALGVLRRVDARVLGTVLSTTPPAGGRTGGHRRAETTSSLT